jgi:hypothetical protein
MTSNLGVESFRESAPGFGQRDQSASWQEHFLTQLQKFVRPEFFNRIDQIVAFKPLDSKAMRQITLRELSEFRKRHGIAARRLELKISENAIDWLVAHGHETRYGARPLKRLINKGLIQPMAQQLNQYGFDLPLGGSVDMTDHNLVERSAKPPTTTSRETTTSELAVNLKSVVASSLEAILPRDKIAERLRKLAQQRRRIQALTSSPSIIRIRNRIFRLDQSLEELNSSREIIGKSEVYDPRIVMLRNELHKLRNLDDEVRQLEQRVFGFEDQTLRQVYSHQAVDWSQFANSTSDFEQLITKLILKLFLSEEPKSPQVNVVMYSRDQESMKFMLQAYEAFAEKHNLKIIYNSLHRPNPELSEEEKQEIIFSLRAATGIDGQSGSERQISIVDVRHHRRSATLFSRSDQIGIALSIKGDLAYHWFALERGVHQFGERHYTSVIVETSGGRLVEHVVPQSVDLLQLALFEIEPLRRQYNTLEKTVADAILGGKKRTVTRWTDTIIELVEEAFHQHLNRFVNTWT